MSFPWTYKFSQFTRRKILLLALESFWLPWCKIFVYELSKLPLRLYHAFRNKIHHLSISWLYFSMVVLLMISLLMVFLFEIPSNGSLFEIPDDPLCYVSQCSLFAYLILSSLYEMCLGVLHYNSLYALSLHSTLAHLWIPFLCMLGGIRELVLHDIINSSCYYI